MSTTIHENFLYLLGKDVDYSVSAFVKAYRVIESCQTPEQLDLARSYLSIVENRMVPRLLPVCQVLHTMLSVRLGEINQRTE